MRVQSQRLKGRKDVVIIYGAKRQQEPNLRSRLMPKIHRRRDSTRRRRRRCVLGLRVAFVYRKQ